MTLNRCLSSSIFLSIIFLLTGCVNSNESKIAFVGDSIVAGWDVEFYFPYNDVVNYGTNGAKIEDIGKWSVEASTVILLVGTNNIASKIKDDSLSISYINEFVGIYKQTILNIKAHRTIVISILPRYDIDKNKSLSINKQIDVVNTQLELTIGQISNVTFLNLSNNFKDKNGQLDMNYSTDGIHLNVYGYQLLSAKLSAIL